MTNTQLKTAIDTDVTNKTLPKSLSNVNLGNDMKAIVDYTDQQILLIGNYKVAKTTITSDQILDIFTTPITIVPAVSGKIIVPSCIVIKINYNSNTYSDVGGSWKIRYGSTSTAIATTTSYLGSATYNQQTIQTLFYSSFTTSSAFDNSPILLTTSGNNPLGGNSGIDVYVTYTEITL
jgi:hypothetical protein